MPDNTFDIVSKIDLAEVNNAIQQALKEIHQRFDLKDSKSDIQLNEKDNKIRAGERGRVQAEGRHRRAGAEAGEAQGAAERPDLRPGDARRPGPAFARKSRCSKAFRSKRRARS